MRACAALNDRHMDVRAEVSTARGFSPWMAAKKFGEVPEWLNGLAWKVSIRLTAYRGFEPLSLRQNQSSLTTTTESERMF